MRKKTHALPHVAVRMRAPAGIFDDSHTSSFCYEHPPPQPPETGFRPLRSARASCRNLRLIFVCVSAIRDPYARKCIHVGDVYQTGAISSTRCVRVFWADKCMVEIMQILVSANASRDACDCLSLSVCIPGKLYMGHQTGTVDIE